MSNRSLKKNDRRYDTSSNRDFEAAKMPGMAPPELNLTCSEGSCAGDLSKQVAQCRMPADAKTDATTDLGKPANQVAPANQPGTRSNGPANTASPPSTVEKTWKQLKNHHERPPKGCSFVYSRFKSQLQSGIVRKFKYKIADNCKGKTPKTFMYDQKPYVRVNDPTPGQLLEQHLRGKYQNATKGMNAFKYPSYGKGQTLFTTRVPAGEKHLILLERWVTKGTMSCVRMTKCTDANGKVRYIDPVGVMGNIEYVTGAGGGKRIKVPCGGQTPYTPFMHKLGVDPDRVGKMKGLKQQDAAPFAHG
ncbi:MAG: hypothetical protein AAF570_17500 [Bacteroidota bacterium]